MKIVGFLSCYKEGRLVRAAIESLLRVELDALYVYEGPAGEPIDADVPESDLPDVGEIACRLVPHRRHSRDDRATIRHGRWRTDSRKRNEMLQRAQRDFPGEEVWAVVVDGDEVLRNGEYLRDLIQKVSWDDAARSADPNDPDNPPTAHWPIRLVEVDGGITTMLARIIRVDLLRSYDVSSSLLTNMHGVRLGWGNIDDGRAWIDLWMQACERDKLTVWPPGPIEPCIVHRPHLRHPLRRGVRMSEQELRELAKARADAEPNW